MSRGEVIDNLYLIESGQVEVYDRNNGEQLAVLPTHGYFGDYQILLDTRSNVSFKSHTKSKVICYTINKDKFIRLLNAHPSHTQFFMERAMCTRRLFKRLVIINKHKAVSVCVIV